MKALDNPANPRPATNIVTNTSFPTNMEGMEDVIQQHVDDVRLRCEEHLEWALLEIVHWKEKCEELEVELISVDAYSVNEYIENIRPKKRGNFK